MDNTTVAAPNEKTTFSDKPSPELFLESKRMDLDSGWLGKLFGGSTTAPTNIAGLSLMLLLIAGVALLFFNSATMTAADYWKIITPIITLVLGYLFGKKS
jgi:hypothetical protein